MTVVISKYIISGRKVITGALEYVADEIRTSVKCPFQATWICFPVFALWLW